MASKTELQQLKEKLDELEKRVEAETKVPVPREERL